MSQQLLFDRSAGILGPNTLARLQTTQLLRSFRAAPRFRFDGGERLLADAAAGGGSNPRTSTNQWAHQAGVNALALECFDGRILVSGGSDATIRLWDLEQAANPTLAHTFQPIGQVARAAPGPSPGTRSGSGSRTGVGAGPSTTNTTATSGHHRYGITDLSFYPFDSDAFLSSSYDQTLKLWATRGARLSGSFDLGAKVYAHAMSRAAAHLLVACATQHPAVRLVDLRSGAAVQSLVSSADGRGANLAVAWSPVHEHVLASGSVDGAVRIWDVRRASGLLGLLDQEDGLGILYNGTSSSNSNTGTERRPRIRLSARAHTGAANGLAWTSDGAYLVTAGHDRRIRVWDAATGANTLVNFGPAVRNPPQPPSRLNMLVSPAGLSPTGSEMLFYPNETEILVADLHSGSVVARLRGMGASVAAVRTTTTSNNTSSPRQAAAGTGTGTGTGGVTERTVRNRLTSMVWRGAGGGAGPVMGGTNAAGGIFSGHLDGQIRAWVPLLLEGGVVDDEDEMGLGPSSSSSSRGGRGDDGEEGEGEERARKKRALDSAFRNLMGRGITFT